VWFSRLQAGREIRALMDGQSVLVKSDIAVAQIEADRAREQTSEAASPTNGGQSRTPETGRPAATAVASADVVAVPVRPRRFHGSVTLEATRLSRDAGKVAEEVVQHLTGQVGATVNITIEINAHWTTGFPENVVSPRIFAHFYAEMTYSQAHRSSISG
jgi:hypothetical protein